MNIAIIGAGGIAGKMAETVNQLRKNGEDVTLYAVGSRYMEKAMAFAEKFGATKAYGSYDELAADDKIDLVYVATPHSEHYNNAKLCLENGRNVIVEKAFTVNSKQAIELFKLAESKNLMITEAIWTRYLPIQRTLEELIKSGTIGTPTSLTANLGYKIDNVARLTDPELAGGALLDLGVYPINFASMIFGNDIEKITSDCAYTASGVDRQNTIILHYRDGKIATLNSTMSANTDLRGMVYGDEGSIEAVNINNIEKLIIRDNQGRVKIIERPEQLTGFEYELLSAINAIKNGESECPEMPHSESIKMLRIMDSLRRSWKIIYPFEQ